MEISYHDVTNIYEDNLDYFMDYLNYMLNYFKECAPSVIHQGILSSYTGLLFCFLINIICSLIHKFKGDGIIKEIFISIINTAAGTYLLVNTYENGAWNVLLFAGTSVCIICVIKPRPRMIGTVSLCIFYLVFNELFVDPKKWHSVRGSLMILLMKIISVSIDIDNGHLKEVSVLRLCGYLLTPCTIIYGPWLHYTSYVSWCRQSRMNWRSILASTNAFILSFVFLLYSTCISQALFSNLPDNKWIRAYQDAQSFRFSHYFISYLSLSYVYAMNIGLDTDSAYTNMSIVQPLSIELPRSLLDVVTLWNLPMHVWLKKYVFLPCRKYGRFVAIITTFAVSSLLHGFNFALSAILVSLGIYSYIEYVFRAQLARLLSACVKAKACREPCDHKRKSGHIFTRSVNSVLTVVDIFHLAYVAAMFDSGEDQVEGYSMGHTIASWRSLRFSGHVVAFVTYLTYLSLRCLSSQSLL